MITVPIYNYALPKKTRVFDVEVSRDGRILKYITKNIRGCVCIDDKEVQRQIKDALRTMNIKNAC